jgi:hypothetical protein
MQKMVQKPKHLVEAPKPTFHEAPTVLSVQLVEDEEVQWIWTHTSKGSYVSGYTIANKKRANERAKPAHPDGQVPQKKWTQEPY